MLTPLLGLDEEAVVELLATEFGSSVDCILFEPLGEDSWCYRAGNLWVSVRRDLRGHNPAAYAAATELRERGAEFVLAPLRGASGAVVHSVDDFPMVVFPYVESSSLDRVSTSRVERRQVIAMLSELHGSTLDLDLATESFDLPFLAELELVERVATGEQPAGGPYADPLGRLLQAHYEQVLEWRAEYDELATQYRRGGFAPRLTHGEPLASNVLRTAQGLMLADWGELMVGPAERDWSHLERTLGTKPPCDPDLRRLYALRWRLSEVGEYTAALAKPHAGGADEDAMWERLTRYLPTVPVAGEGAVAR